MRAGSTVAWALALGMMAGAGSAVARLEAPAAAASSNTYERLLQESGIGEQIDSLPETVSAGLVEGAGSLPSQLQAQLRSETLQAFNAVKFRARVLASLKGNVTGADVDTVLAWLRTPLGRRLTEAERRLNQPEGQAALKARMETPVILPAERQHVLAALDEASGGTQFLVDIQERSARASVRAMASVSGQSPAALMEQLQPMLEQTREPVREMSRQYVLAGYAETYRDISDADLQRYLAFNESAPCRRFNRALTAAYLNAVDGAVDELVRALLRTAQQHGVQDSLH